MKPLRQLSSKTLVLDQDNIDTDQIIPARFLTTTSRDGLAAAAFADWRFDEQGRPKADSPLNAPTAQTCEILVAGDNFGCGSSREHAVWALMQFGFRVVISAKIADIFRANALKNGLLAIEVDRDTQRWLLAHPGAELNIDVTECRLDLPGNGAGTELWSVTFELDPFARTCLLEGVDALGYLLAQSDAIAEFEQRREAA
ncbi:MAG: 3-isopropylmalate dehydratase small subunit [Wenzhouxiangella sp.]|nr:3-isopropylmalate dehydratase small subunit [Wenzhouxiangella sp.]MCH8476431.1 3-isopropylmalate dehydratase small subunit [Wenzhouxiangella sp.]TVR95138.1 MAG: 3-isopropylmalate dehydratase small subunit [Wenzhouxiangellaceae bacterium]